ncbi:hypothetical protein ACFPLB_07845 [Aquamicrobium segne]|uniref:Glucosamine inositolphosphorylceramide transferase 1 N-terminal domain-containing protein n=1 Tax=Aquamicrobium segne TaxID=469547 RepID=A0ABW0GXB8_9HYPH
MQMKNDGFTVGMIDVVVPQETVRRFHVAIVERLRQRGYDVALVGAQAAQPVTGAMSRLDRIFGFERRFLRIRMNSLLDKMPGEILLSPRPDAVLRLDLSGGELQGTHPTLVPLFSGSPCLLAAADMLLRGQLPDVTIALDGRHCIARAAPMVDSRLSLMRGLDDVLAGMITLLVSSAQRHLNVETDGGEIGKDAMLQEVFPDRQKDFSSRQLPGTYLLSMLPRQIIGTFRRLLFHVHRWEVHYRFHKGVRVADTGLLAGEPWITLPDDGERFYADPFPFEWQGRHFIFVEDFRHGSSKAVISVAEIFDDGTATVPRCVLEEPHHLSYPQVFARDGEIWMLPEGGESRELVLYRAENFPDRWVRYAVLIPERELFDATLLEHENRLWLFATECYGCGSASDTLVVFSALDLQGPWVPHPANPVMIDRAAARPGGGFVRIAERLVVPMQDGTNGYGGGLGLADLVELDEKSVRLTIPVPLLSPEKLPFPKVHTLNSSEKLEAIDRIAPAWRLKWCRT